MAKWTKEEVAALAISTGLEIPFYVLTWKATNLINPSRNVIAKLINIAGTLMIGDLYAHTAKRAFLEDVEKVVKSCESTDSTGDALHKAFYGK